MSILICLLKDKLRILILSLSWLFNPSALCRVVSHLETLERIYGRISIHPPRAGRDPEPATAGVIDDISIHPPHVERDIAIIGPSVLLTISIHPPRAGRDRALPAGRRPYSHFNLPAPCGAGPNLYTVTTPKAIFQSTRPVRGGT